MKMDTSRWIQLNSNVQFHKTRKLFYNKYLYRISFRLPGASIIKYNKTPEQIENKIELRKKWDDQFKNPDFEKLHRIYPSILSLPKPKYFSNQIVIEQLQWWADTLEKNSSIIYRVEEPKISVYGGDADELFDIFKDEPLLPDSLLDVCLPSSSEAEEALSKGNIIVKHVIGYTHKVILKDAVLSITHKKLESRKNVLEYLESLGEEIKIPQYTKHALKNAWSTQSYFYCKDPKIVTFLELISPGIVANIFELTRIVD